MVDGETPPRPKGRHRNDDPLGNLDGEQLWDDHLLVRIHNINMANGYVEIRLQNNGNPWNGS